MLRSLRFKSRATCGYIAQEQTHLKQMPPPNIVLYGYHNSRAAACVMNYLDGYQGYLQVDGYQAYEKTQPPLVG